MHVKDREKKSRSPNMVPKNKKGKKQKQSQNKYYYYYHFVPSWFFLFSASVKLECNNKRAISAARLYSTTLNYLIQIEFGFLHISLP